MKTNVVAPSVGESITEVSILKWARKNGEAVKKGDPLLEIESDKATVEVVADGNGTLQIMKQAGEKVGIGAVLGVIDDSVAATAASSASATSASASASKPAPASAPSTGGAAGMPLSPAVGRIVAETGVSTSGIQGTGKDGRLTKGDVIQHINGGGASGNGAAPSLPSTPRPPTREGERRVPMSNLRMKIAERLVFAQHTAAILTTFNEVDLSGVMKLRSDYKEKFQAKHGVALSFMSFFTRAATLALKAIPEVNASIEGNEVVYHDFVDMGIAVGTDRGLVVPVIRGAHTATFVDIEKKMGELAKKARDGKLSIADMSGGTFTISNGGTYGSLLSTPILNPPQSAILGMHKIMDRPIAVNGKVEIRPMMYLALSYDHRLIDGKGAVTFLVHMKDSLENPEKLNLDFVSGLK